MTLHRHRQLLLAILVLLTAVLAPPAVQGHANVQPSDCSADLPNVGAQPPVLLVHGFISDAQSGWAATGQRTGPVQQRLEGDGNYVEPFDYKPFATRWVTNPNIGPRLADAVHRLSEASRCSGGDGHIIVIAHSMGGLAVRCALTSSCGGRDDMAGTVGLVITLGTPHLGSHLRDNARDFIGTHGAGNALRAFCSKFNPSVYVLRSLNTKYNEVCDTIGALLRSEAGRAFTMGSQELAALPPFPPGVPVRALAGDIRLLAPTLFSARFYDIGDGPVSTQSASATSTEEAYGGHRVYPCGLLSLTETPHCTHLSLTKTSDFVDDVAGTVRVYRESLAKRAQEAAAAAAAAAEAAQRAEAEHGVLPAPRGPVLKVGKEQAPYPFAVQAIAAQTQPQIQGEPAPAGYKWVVIALQMRGLLTDRAIEPPEPFLLNVTWPTPDCVTYFDDQYICNIEQLEAISRYLPIDATDYTGPGTLTQSDVIPPGERYDIMYKALVSEEFSLATGRVKYGLPPIGGPDRRESLPLSGLPTLD